MEESTIRLDASKALRRLTIPGGWTEQRIRCGGQTWEILLPANADEFLNQLEALPSGAEEPDIYWAKLWPPARTMAEFVLRAGWPAETRVLELGCGIGVVGLAGLAAGWQVTFSDHTAVAVELALANAARNGYSRARGLVFDWKQPVNEQFDVILGSDILYDRTAHSALVDVLIRMLRPGGTVWIGDAGRYHVSSFVELAWERGFEIGLSDEREFPLSDLTIGRFQLLKIHCPANDAAAVCGDGLHATAGPESTHQ